MKMPRLLTFIALAFVALAPVSVQAQVRASLVGAEQSIQPGRSFTVAVRLQHDPHWHTYWVNPGTGLTTTITWNLPEGFVASEIQWPAPHVLKDHAGNIVGNGYEGDQLLPVTITPPADLAPGSTVTLKAATDWLMCEEVCMPGSANLQLTLPVSSATPKPDGALGQRVLDTVAGLPTALDAWSVNARRDAQTITLTVTPKSADAFQPKDLRFFADDNLVAYELPQTIKSDGRGGFILTLPISPDGPPDATRLLGVLTSENGWAAGGSPRGLRVDVPFGQAGQASDLPQGGAEPLTAAAPTPLLGTLALAFLGGLILNLMPCVFPVLGIKIMGFVNQAGSDKRKVVMHGIVFTLGVLLSFWVLAGMLAVLRAGGDQLGWGFQLQSPAFVYVLTGFLLVFALNLSGVFEFGLTAVGVGANLQMKGGYAGSFFTGILATVVATPCSAPFLAPALGAALALPLGESFVIFTAIALGLSAPYLLLSIFPQAIKVLPRPGAWMETFKQFMAFPLYATVAALVWVMAGQLSEGGMLMALFGLVLIAMGVWFYGRWHAPGASAGRARFGLVAGAVVLALGIWTGWPQPPAPTAITWEKWSEETVAHYRAEGRPIYVDFTARWCATCQTNKKLVFGSNEVLKYFADKKVVALKGDWTNQDPKITAELAKYQRSAVPFNVIWLPGQNDPVILPEILTPGVVLDAFRQG